MVLLEKLHLVSVKTMSQIARNLGALNIGSGEWFGKFHLKLQQTWHLGKTRTFKRVDQCVP